MLSLIVLAYISGSFSTYAQMSEGACIRHGKFNKSSNKTGIKSSYEEYYSRMLGIGEKSTITTDSLEDIINILRIHFNDSELLEYILGVLNLQENTEITQNGYDFIDNLIPFVPKEATKSKEFWKTVSEILPTVVSLVSKEESILGANNWETCATVKEGGILFVFFIILLDYFNYFIICCQSNVVLTLEML